MSDDNGTIDEVNALKVESQRPFKKLIFSRPRKDFGAPTKFSDSADNSQQIKVLRETLDLIERYTLDTGTQAVPALFDREGQTAYFRPVHNTTQYNHKDFLKTNQLGESEEQQLNEFLSTVEFKVEESLQQNETFDIYRDEVAMLGEDDGGFGTQTNAADRDHRTLNDLVYSRHKRLHRVSWVPGFLDLVATVAMDNRTAADRLESSGRAQDAFVPIWQIDESVSPRLVLRADSDVVSLEFCPHDPSVVVGGLMNGQIVCWKIDLEVLREADNIKKNHAVAIDGESKVDTIYLSLASDVEVSHRRSTTSITWLPFDIDYDRRRNVLYQLSSTIRNPMQQQQLLNNPEKIPQLMMTTGSDGSVHLWNWTAMYNNLIETVKQGGPPLTATGMPSHTRGNDDRHGCLRPIHSIYLTRPDSGCDLGVCHALLASDLTCLNINSHIWASSDEGDLVDIEIAPVPPKKSGGEENADASNTHQKKIEYLKKIYNSERSYRPTIALARSPFLKNIICLCNDWYFTLWDEDSLKNEQLATPIFRSGQPPHHYTSAIWSPTRPLVLLLGRRDGILEFWDFADASHKMSASVPISSEALISIAFQDDLRNITVNDKLQLAASQVAIGDATGGLHIITLPKSLYRPIGHEGAIGSNNPQANKAATLTGAVVQDAELEKNLLKSFVERELIRSLHFAKRFDQLKQEADSMKGGRQSNGGHSSPTSGGKGHQPAVSGLGGDEADDNAIEGVELDTIQSATDHSFLQGLQDLYATLESQLLVELGLINDEGDDGAEENSTTQRSPNRSKRATGGNKGGTALKMK